MSTPSFFLVGAAKSGTTTLYHAMRHHSDIYLPEVKEPHVYAYLADPKAVGPLYADEAAARKDYRELYSDVGDQRAVGDASTSNLVVPGAAAAIAEDVPEAKIVVVLRHPVDRAFSHFRHFAVAGGEDLTNFADAVRAEASRQEEGFPFTYRYLGWSRYVEQLRPFFDLFGRERVLVHLYDDLSSDAEAVVRSTFRFLAVEADGPLAPVGRSNEVIASTPVPVRPSSTGRPRGVLRHLVKRLPKGRWEQAMDATPVKPAPELDPAFRAELTEGFADEISQLEDLIGRDLSSWR